jgi:hypothetical protein
MRRVCRHVPSSTTRVFGGVWGHGAGVSEGKRSTASSSDGSFSFTPAGSSSKSTNCRLGMARPAARAVPVDFHDSRSWRTSNTRVFVGTTGRCGQMQNSRRIQHWWHRPGRSLKVRARIGLNQSTPTSEMR